MYSGTFTFYRNRKIATKSREFNCATRSKYTKFEDLQLIWDLINELFKKMPLKCWMRQKQMLRSTVEIGQNLLKDSNQKSVHWSRKISIIWLLMSDQIQQITSLQALLLNYFVISSSLCYFWIRSSICSYVRSTTWKRLAIHSVGSWKLWLMQKRQLSLGLFNIIICNLSPIFESFWS